MFRGDDHHGQLRVQDKLVAHAPQQQLAETTQAAASGHDEIRLLLVGNRDQRRRRRTGLEDGPIADAGLLQGRGPLILKTAP